MARSKISNVASDMVSDPGGVLWSFVMGEQLEFEVNLGFLPSTVDGATYYTAEAVVLEGDGALGERPTGIRSGGKSHAVGVNFLPAATAWSSSATYTVGDIVQYNQDGTQPNTFFRCLRPVTVADYNPFTQPAYWKALTGKEVYLQFQGIDDANTVVVENSVGSGWVNKPTPDINVYGFFELRITEKTGVFKRTWKPLRGMVELLWSPTLGAYG
jgi:hypothetical protein